MLEALEITPTTGALLVTCAICWFAVSGTRKQKNNKAPPSLPRLPIVGSVPFLSGLSSLHVCLTEKCKKYGNIFSMYTGSRQVVVLNGHDLIREALVKNSTEFSGRGKVYSEKYGWSDAGKGIVASAGSEAQRRTRSNCLTVLKSFGFNSRAVMEQRIQEEVTHLTQYARQMEGQAWYPAPLLEHSTLNVMHSLMFGERISLGDLQGQDITGLCHKLSKTAYAMLDVFPIATGVQPKREDYVKVYEKYMEFCEAKVDESINGADTGSDNFVKEYLKINGTETFNKRDMAVVIRDLILAGAETTSGQLNWALILLANHPDVQSRLQQEMDSVVPRDRAVSLFDKPVLPYMEAVILEVFRFRTAAPLGIPRQTLEDTEIGGYRIPAGSEILVNLWSAHMDSEVWTEPEKFNPDRFLDGNGEIINRELMITFSHGKRACPGETLARQEMFLFLATLVQQFNILPPEGEVKVKDEMCFIRTITAVEHTMRLVPRNVE